MDKVKVPTEEEIINRIDVDWSKPLVTFLCITYNQQDYIEDTLIGFLRQKTSFPYEILIHDDSSTDRTRNVIDYYSTHYPTLIRTIYQDYNQYSQGKSVSVIAAKEAKADYIALCEGDDYWINDNKIENQLSLILEDTSITMVVSPGKEQFDDKISSTIIGFHGNRVKKISPQYILDVKGGLAPTASYIVRKDYLIKSRELFIDAPVGDLFIELYNAVYGKLLYYPEVVCVYRRMAKNSWSSKMASNLDNAIKHSEGMQKTIEYSKKIDGFKSLDWTNARASNLFNLAILHLYQNDIDGFEKYIDLSNTYKTPTGRKRIIFKMRNHGQFLYYVLHTRKYILSKFRSLITKSK